MSQQQTSKIKFPQIEGLIMLFEHNYKQEGFALFVGVHPEDRSCFQLRVASCNMYYIANDPAPSPESEVKWEDTLATYYSLAKEAAIKMNVLSQQYLREIGIYVIN